MSTAGAGNPLQPKLGSGLFFGFSSHFDELFVSGGFNDFRLAVGTAGQNGVSDAAGVDGDSLGGVVIARNNVVNAIRRVVRVDDADDRDAKLVGFLDGDLVVADVNDEESVRKSGHFLDATDGLVELFNVALEVEGFLLRQVGSRAVFELLLHVLETLDRAAHRLEVGERTAEPALVNPAAAATLGFGGDDFATAALGVDEEDLAALSGELAGELAGFFELGNRLFEVDDVNLVAGAKDVLTHLRVPETGLVTEMATSFKHFTHADHD